MLRSSSALPSVLRDAGLYALVAFGLCVPIISYRTEAGPGTDLLLLPRWGLVAALCAAIFGVRLLLRQGSTVPRARRDGLSRSHRAERNPAVFGLDHVGRRH